VQSIRWSPAYALSFRDIEEEMRQARGFCVDPSPINRWVLPYSPQLDVAFRQEEKRVGNRCRMDETYLKVNGPGKYDCRAIAKQGNTSDCLLTATRDRQAALWFLKKAINENGSPCLVHID
jgi:transposase-like protein